MGDHDDENGNGNNLPPGFRFCPSDEELVSQFLQRKTRQLPIYPDVIPDLDLIPYNPWELQENAFSDGGIWYYYSRRTQNRATESGYWKEMGMEEPVMSTRSNKVVGLKKYFVFHICEPNTEVWTNWIMHQYSLPNSAKTRSRHGYKKWVICKVYEQKNDDDDDDDDNTQLSCLDEVFLSMDDYDEVCFPNSIDR